jgi:hypothetical protein
MVIFAPGATDAGALKAKSVIEMTAPSADDEGESPGAAVLEPDGGLDDMEVADGAAPESVVDEPQADRPRASVGTRARRVSLRVTWCLQIRGPFEDHHVEFGAESFAAWSAFRPSRDGVHHA